MQRRHYYGEIEGGEGYSTGRGRKERYPSKRQRRKKRRKTGFGGGLGLDGLGVHCRLVLLVPLCVERSSQYVRGKRKKEGERGKGMGKDEPLPLA